MRIIVKETSKKGKWGEAGTGISAGRSCDLDGTKGGCLVRELKRIL